MLHPQAVDWSLAGLVGGTALTLLGGAVALWLAGAKASGTLARAFWPAALLGPAIALTCGAAIAFGGPSLRPEGGNGEPKGSDTVCMCPEGRASARQSVEWKGRSAVGDRHVLDLHVSGATSADLDGDWSVCVGVPEGLAVQDDSGVWVRWGEAHTHPPGCDRDEAEGYQTYLYTHLADEPFAGLPPLPLQVVRERAQYRVGVRWGEGTPSLENNGGRLSLGPASTLVLSASESRVR